MEQWNSDMSSAPKDATRVDLWVNFPGLGTRRVADAYWNGHNWQLGQYNEGQYLHRPRIIAWMPPPPPPSLSV